MNVFSAVEDLVYFAFNFAAQSQTFEFCIYAGSLIILTYLKFLSYIKTSYI